VTSSSRAAKREVKPGGMCWAMTMGGQSGGISESTTRIASTPPVEAPMAISAPDEIDRSQFQGKQRLARPLGGERRDHDHRQGPQPHQLVEELQPVHVGHLDVERHHIRVEQLDLLARIDRVFGGADHHDVAVAAQGAGQDLADEGGIVNDEDLDAHAASLVFCAGLDW